MRWKKKVRPTHGTAILKTNRMWFPKVCVAEDGSKEYVWLENVTELFVYGYAGWEKVARFSSTNVTSPSMVKVLENELEYLREYRYYDVTLKDPRFIQTNEGTDKVIKLTPLVFNDNV